MVRQSNLVRHEDSLKPRELRDLRASTQRSQAAFADALAIAPNTYARMERGEMAVRPTLGRLIVYVVADQTARSAEAVRKALVNQRATKQATRKRSTAVTPKLNADGMRHRLPTAKEMARYRKAKERM